MLPEIDNYFDPTGAPVEEWDGIPVMPQATVGEQFGEATYSYTVPVTANEVESFYNQSMEELGWSSTFSLPIADEGGILSFQKDNEFIIITITPDQTDSNSVDVLLQK